MMKRILSTLFTALLCLVSYQSILHADLTQITMEEGYTQRIQYALDSLYGKSNFIARVKVTLSIPQSKIKYTNQANPVMPPKKEENKKEKEINLLPGYPVIKNLGGAGGEAATQLPFDSVTTYVQPQIQKITVDLIINKSFPKGQVSKAQKMITDMLDLKMPRDVINLTYEKFYEEPKPVAASADDAKPNAKPQEIVIKQGGGLFSIQNLFNLIFAGLFGFFIFTYIVSQARTVSAINKMKPAGDPNNNGGNAPNISVNPSFEMPKGESGGPGGEIQLKPAPQIKHYFNFISDANVDSLLSIIKKDNMPMDQVAMILAFLPPSVVVRVLSTMELKDQAVIATGLLTEKMVSRPIIEKLEAKVKDYIECMAGGPSPFKKVFDLVSSEVKKKLLGLLSKSDPAGYKLFRANIIVFDDLKFLTDDELKLVVSDINLEKLATSLVSVEEATYKKIDQNLPKSSKDMVKQFLDLKGKSVSKPEVEAAQDYILNVIAKFESEGKISLKARVKGQGG